mgnify:CR=1 FL=1
MDNESQKILKLFNDKTKELHSNSDFFKNLNVSLNVKVGDNSSIKFSGPDKKTLKAFLLDFRHFYAQKSQINFLRVCNLIAKENLTNKELIEKIEKSRAVWNLLLKRENEIPIEINDKKLASGDDLLNLMLNGNFFHLDEEKNNEVTSALNSPAQSFVMFNFLDLIQRLSGIIIWFSKEVVEGIL